MELFEEIRREYRFGAGTDPGRGQEVEDAPEDGAAGAGQRDSAGAQDCSAEQSEAGAGESVHRRDFAERSGSSAQATAHRTPDLGADSPGAPRSAGGGSNGAEIRSATEGRTGAGGGETFVPQSYDWGGEGQVDWYEAAVDFDDGRQTAHFFTMRSMAGGGAFHTVYFHATQQAFLEAHARAFHYFGGVFRLMRYDNLKSAVKKILRGYQREETDRQIAFRSHWGFETQFCNPARGNEKGGVKGEVGYFRRNHLVPVPKVKDLGELNAYLRACCQQDEQRRIHGKPHTVGEAMGIECEHLLPLVSEGFELTQTSFPVVDGQGCVKVRTRL